MEFGIIIFSFLILALSIKAGDRIIFLVKKFRYNKYTMIDSMVRFRKNDIVRLPTGSTCKIIATHGSMIWIKTINLDENVQNRE